MLKKIFGGLLVTLLLWCPSAMATITLAIIAPKAGEYLKSGQELFEGARIAVQEINDNGGINGQNIDLLTIDDRCDDRLAFSTAEMLSLLKSKTIGLVVGPYCASRFDEIAAIYEKAKIFQIVPITESYRAGNYNKKGQIVLLANKTQMSKDFFEFYNTHFAGLNVGFVYDGRPDKGYTDVAKTLYDEFKHKGKSAQLKFYTLNVEDDDIKALARKIVKEDNVQVVFVLGDDDDVALLLPALKKKNRNVILFTGKDMISKELLEDMEEQADGVYVLSLPGLKDSLMFTDSLVDLRLHGIEPEGLETYSYVSVKLWGDLAKQVKSFDYNKLSKAANSQEMRTKWSDFLMHSGSKSTAKYVIEMYSDGAFKQVY